MDQWKSPKRERLYGVTTTLWLMLGGLIVLNLQSGPVDVDWTGWIKSLSGSGVAEASRDHVVIMEIRLPRILMAILVGASLAVAGTALQGLFRNPLADPGLIGVSSGGAMGAIVGIMFAVPLAGFSPWLAGLNVPVCAMLGGMGVTWAIYRLAQIGGSTHVTTLLLAGIAVNAMAGALVGSLLYMSNNEALRQFTFWTLGSLHRATWENLGYLVPFTVIPLILLPYSSRALNAFLLGEGQAYHLGVRVQRVKRSIVLLSAAMVGATVAFCGLISFVGLVIPHILRLAVGPDHNRLFPLSILAGANLLLLGDWISRTANPPTEIPIGILTALVGAPFFLYLIQRRKRSISW